MRFRVDRDVLADAVTWTARSLPTRPPVPVLAGVRIEADPTGTIQLSSFDYEVSARAQLPADVSEPGTVLVSGRLLAEISRALPAKPVDVVLEGTKVQVTCGASRFTLLTMPVEDYPNLPVMPPVTGTVDGDELTHAVAQVSVAASRDDTLPLLTGVRVEIEGEKVTLLATDRYRLALREMTWKPASPGVEAVALVRARTLSDAAKSLGGSGSVSVALSTGGGVDLIGFEAGGRQTTSLLVDGDYPPQVWDVHPPTRPHQAGCTAWTGSRSSSSGPSRSGTSASSVCGSRTCWGCSSRSRSHPPSSSRPSARASGSTAAPSRASRACTRPT